MTPATAYLVHHTAGRYRLRIPARRRDADFFEQLAQPLAEHDKIHRVSINSQTAGVLIEHAGLELAELQNYADEQGLFRLEPGDVPKPAVFDHAVARLRGLNRQVSESTGQHFDLRGAVFVLLIMLGLRELMRGNLMAPAASLFWYAYNTLQSGPIEPE